MACAGMTAADSENAFVTESAYNLIFSNNSNQRRVIVVRDHKRCIVGGYMIEASRQSSQWLQLICHSIPGEGSMGPAPVGRDVKASINPGLRFTAPFRA